ncbi:HPP family protein [Pedomonas mirosovicensis]|uniref:HPP family protein n=1 Tax=Pedomonas mirosovicensis TaxID=2908641 RepID=UPI0021686A78|nr:HPP family protein [Pedomonas mirosovicensis]MCH8683835.1 HPP family protein [Pedomonas mirosovicensis]
MLTVTGRSGIRPARKSPFQQQFNSVRHYITRHQPKTHPRHSVLAGLGGIVGIGMVAGLSVWSGNPFLIAPFGASAVLLFSTPDSPLSQPAHVVGGHFIGALVGLILHAFLPDTWWAAAMGVGLAITIMSALRLTHPPAGGNPLVVFASDPNFGFLFMPVLLGSACLVATACLYHRLTRVPYPRRPEPAPAIS